MTEKIKPNEFTITRIYNTPVEQLWRYWTEEKHVEKWWGPRGFSISTKSKDLKPGGRWIYTMHGPDGVDYPNVTTYHVVEKNSRLVYDHGGNEERDSLFRVTAIFKEIALGKSQLQMTMALKTAKEANDIKKFIKQVNGNTTWDRLGEYIEKENTGIEKFIINRTFNVNRQLLFQMWTDPSYLSKWLAPTGFEMVFIKTNISEGESSFYSMTNGSNLTMYGKFYYKKIQPNNYFEYTQEFSDKTEKQSRHPMAPTWPAMMLTKIWLTEEGSDQTRLTIEWSPIGEVNSEELLTFINGRDGMTLGWSSSFAKLENCLGKDSF